MHDCLDRPAAFLRRLGGGAEHARLPVAEAALALAVLDRPALDASRGGRNRYLAHLDELAREVALEADRGIAALWLALGGTFAYRGDAKTYDDLANADLMQVIDRRRGLPVTLGILYLHAARAQGWQASGLAFPGHFLIRVEAGAESLILDPFGGGRPVDTPQLRSFLAAVTPGTTLSPEHLQPVSDRQILLRLQNNLKSRLIQADSFEKALEVVERMLLLAPKDAALWRDSGLLAVRLDRIGAALAALGQSVKFAQTTEERSEADGLMRQLRSRLN